ncbi:MAG: DUF4105 domain-containing protein [Bacteriovoracaceae bacterium]|nr:DUF4105 domain-containing protein [Bacteriovoracaceae bacterium]
MAQANVESWAKEPLWLNMVHYKKTLFGYAAQADGEASYLSKNGKSDPVEELEATIKAFQSITHPIDSKSALCRFPARYNWLKVKIPTLNLNPVNECPEFREFVSKLNAKSVSLIFSSYFINSPASAFGHTFLRFNSATHRQDDQDQAELLDYGINYAAVMDTSNVLVYATKSMLGLFPGTFTAVPYYYKVREYNDFESRDLWEYKLNFTQPQIDRMVEHMWELGPTYFDYKFFTENCSYHVLSLMEVGNPDLNLTNRLPSLYVIPIDTVRVVIEEPNLVAGSRYRPSVLSRLEFRTKKLSDIEIKIVHDLVNNPLRSEEIVGTIHHPQIRADLLDTAIDGFDFINAKGLVYETKATNAKRHELLTARAVTEYTSKPLSMTPASEFTPENGHRSQRWGGWSGLP